MVSRRSLNWRTPGEIPSSENHEENHAWPLKRSQTDLVEQLQVDEAEVTPAASFQEDLGADSLDVVELVMQFEEAFDIEIPMRMPRRSRPSRTRSSTSRACERRQIASDSPSRITGLGLVCGVGNTAPEVWRQLLAGASGMGRFRALIPLASRSPSPPRSRTLTFRLCG